MIDAGERSIVGPSPPAAPQSEVVADAALSVLHQTATRRDWWPAHACFAALAVASAAVHLIVLTRNGEPSGLDFGNWLTIGHHWLGTGAPGGSTSTYPPVVPLLAVAAVTALGVPAGTAALAAVAGAAPSIAVYAVLSGKTSRIVAVSVATAIAAAGSTGEAVAWGGVPQLLGLGFGLGALAAFVEFLRTPRRALAWRTGILLAATGATTHLILAQIAVCAFTILTAEVAFGWGAVSLRGPWRGRDGLVAHVARIAGPLLPLAPLYLALGDSVGQSFVTRSTTVSWAKTLDAFGSIFGDAPLLWKAALMLALLAPVVLLRRRHQPLWLLTTSILWTDVATVALTGESRLAYLAPLGIATGLGLIASSLPPMPSRAWRRVALAATCALSAVAVTSGLRHFSAQRTYYGERLLPRGTTVALDWVRLHTPARAVVAVAPVDSLPFGWWVEGYGRRATLTGASEQYLNFPRERQRARESIALFGLTDVSAAEFAAQARDVGVSYLYVPTAWHGLAGTSLQRYIDANPSAVVFHNPAAIIVAITP